MTVFYLKSYTTQDSLEFLSKLDEDVKLIDVEDELIKHMKDPDRAPFGKYTNLQIKNRTIAFFDGGTDINSNLYSQTPHSKNDKPDNDRDKLELAFYHSLYNKVLKLGICRGAQLLTVIVGGTLIQDVTGHNSNHSILTFKDFHNNKQASQRIVSNSSHHQMMYPFKLDKNRYEILAASEAFRSDHYQIEKDKQIRLYQDFVEPEIVFYPMNKALAIQGHPEWASADTSYHRFCKHLILQHV